MGSYLKFLKRKEEKAGIRIKYRPYQKKVVETFEQGQRFLLICWARRLGKDMMTFSLAAKQCINIPNSTVFYMFPTQKQGKQMLLEAKTTDHKPIISSVINENLLIKPRHSNKLYHSDNTIRFKNGSIIYIVDALNADTKVGGNIDLLVCSEAALYKNNDVIDYLIPSIIKAGGKVIIVSTPRFGSKFNKMFRDKESGYYKSLISAVSDEAVDNDGSKIYSDEELELAKKLMSEEKFNQEYLCDLDAANELSIYNRSFKMAERRKIQLLPQDEIFIALDLGINDAMALTFGKFTKDEKMAVFHHYRNNNEPTKHYIDYIENKVLKPNNLNKKNVTIILPHDGRNRQDAIETLVSREKAYINAGFKVLVLSQVNVNEAIETTRSAIQHGNLIFAENENVNGFIEIVKEYEWKFNNITGDNLFIPRHSIASNSADSLEYLAITFFFKKKIDKAAYTKEQIRNLGRDY